VPITDANEPAVLAIMLHGGYSPGQVKRSRFDQILQADPGWGRRYARGAISSAIHAHLSGSQYQHCHEDWEWTSIGRLPSCGRQELTIELGVFVPIGNNGWIISTTCRRTCRPFDLNRTVTEQAERYGFEFAMSMIEHYLQDYEKSLSPAVLPRTP
jgi:hypothetical protein